MNNKHKVNNEREQTHEYTMISRKNGRLQLGVRCWGCPRPHLAGRVGPSTRSIWGVWDCNTNNSRPDRNEFGQELAFHPVGTTSRPELSAGKLMWYFIDSSGVLMRDAVGILPAWDQVGSWKWRKIRVRPRRVAEGGSTDYWFCDWVLSARSVDVDTVTEGCFEPSTS